jgi:hypothetical protein
MKAEEFRERWRWVSMMCDDLQRLLFDDTWDQLPEIMVRLFPHFSTIKVNKFMRQPSLWQGCYDRLLQEKPTRG